MGGVWLFCIYRCLMLSVANGSSLMAWGIQFTLAIVQDVFINVPLRLFFIHGLVLKAMRPQLKTIYHVLNNAAVTKLGRKYRDNTVRVSKHLSATCRAARAVAVQNLPSAQLLQTIDDYDISVCRDARKVRLSWIAWILLVVPASFAVFGDFWGDISLEIMTPTLWTGFLVGNDIALQINPYLLYLFYGVIFSLFIVNYYFLKPIKRRRLRNMNKNKVLKQWKSSQYTSKNKVFKNWAKYLQLRHYIHLFSSFFRGSGTLDRRITLRQKQAWRNMNRPFHLQGRVTTRQMIQKQSVPFVFEEERIDIRTGLPASIIEMSRHVTLSSSKWNKQGKSTDVFGSLLSSNTNDGIQSVLARENVDEVNDDQSDAASWVDQLHKAGYTDKNSLTWLASDLMGEEGPTFEAITFDISKKSLRPHIIDQYQDQYSYDDSDLDSDSDSDSYSDSNTVHSSVASFASDHNSVGAFLSVTAEDDTDTVFEVLSFDVVKSITTNDLGGDANSVKSSIATDDQNHHKNDKNNDDVDDSQSSNDDEDSVSGSDSKSSSSDSQSYSSSDSDILSTAKSVTSSIQLPDGSVMEYETLEADVHVLEDDSDQLTVLSSELQNAYEELNLNR